MGPDAVCLIDETISLVVDRAGQTRARGFFYIQQPMVIHNPFLTPPRTLPAISDKGLSLDVPYLCHLTRKDDSPMISRNLSTPQTRGR